jgi:N utilization substance protein B
MAKISRTEARENLFSLLFETEFNREGNPEAIFALSCDNREIPQDKYIKNTFFGVLSRSEIIDRIISRYSQGWKADRLSRVSRTILRIAIYEILFDESIPANVSISQAVALTLKYGEDKSKQFVNGVLSGFNKDVESKGIDAVIAENAAASDEAEPEVEENDESEGKDA